jgi:ATP-dependent RNA helicase DDX47/RRP3
LARKRKRKRKRKIAHAVEGASYCTQPTSFHTSPFSHRSGRAIALVTQYDVEVYQRLEALLGTKLPAFEVEESTALVFLERVSEAQRLATREMKELAAASSSKGRGGKKRRGDDSEEANMRKEARGGYGGGSSGKGGGYHNQRGGGNQKKKRR